MTNDILIVGEFLAGIVCLFGWKLTDDELKLQREISKTQEESIKYKEHKIERLQERLIPIAVLIREIEDLKDKVEKRDREIRKICDENKRIVTKGIKALSDDEIRNLLGDEYPPVSPN